jgi:hypothetical protein
MKLKDLHCDKLTATVQDYFDCFLENRGDGIIYDEDDEKCYRYEYL